MNLPRPPRALRSVVMASALLAGCAPAGDAWRKELADMRRDITSMRAENEALRERLEALEASSPTRAAVSPAPSASTTDPNRDRPALQVVRLSPSESQGDGWVAIDPSDPKRTRLPASAPADGSTTEIRSERGGSVVQRSAPPNSGGAAAPKRNP